jgi:multiple sugar transport system substrate-binding protein
VQGTVDAKGFDYGVAPIPGFDGKPKSPSGSHGLAINPNSAHIQESIDFLTFATTTVDGGMASTELVNAPTLPAGTKARLDTAVTADPRLTGLQDIVAYTVANLYVARPPSPKYNTFELATTAAIADIRNGQDVTTTLQGLQTKLVSLLSR